MHLTEMAAPCYCCPVLKVRKGGDLNDEHASRAELDDALNELGMLSTITDSRQDYLREKMKDQSLRLPGPEMCVLQMNSDFVTNFTFSKSSLSGFSTAGTSSSSEVDESSMADIAPRQARRCWLRPQKNRHLYRPYDFPFSKSDMRRSKVKRFLIESAAAPQHNGVAPPTVVSSSVAIVTRQDSGNKSNPGSPVKSQKQVTNPGCSITRSRSLDDLEISKLNLNECCSNEAGKAEIEIVSQRINNLHVN